MHKAQRKCQLQLTDDNNNVFGILAFRADYLIGSSLLN